MSVYNDIITEIANRLTTAQGVGKPLANVKTVQVGHRKTVESLDQLPIITILVNSINEGNWAIMNGAGHYGNLELSLLVHYGLSSERASNIYSDFVTLLETIANTVYKNTAGNFDPTLNNKLVESFTLEGGRIEKLNELELGYEFILRFKTKTFTRIGR
jgi:hypothetical protein